MRQIIIFFLLLGFVAAASAQEQSFLNLDKSGGKFRYSRIIGVEDDDNQVDTVEIRFFPPQWLDSTQFRNYVTNQVQIESERARELRRLLNETNRARDRFIADINGVFGPGTYDSMQVKAVLASLQGTWRLIEKGESNRELTISGYSADVPAKEGTIVVAADLTVSLRGIYSFNLTFNQLPTGNWKAIRTANGVTREFYLRKPQ
jgi:hypothetical protein